MRSRPNRNSLPPLTEAVRGALLGHPSGGRTLVALAWCGGILALGVLVSSLVLSRRG